MNARDFESKFLSIAITDKHNLRSNFVIFDLCFQTCACVVVFDNNA